MGRKKRKHINPQIIKLLDRLIRIKKSIEAEEEIPQYKASTLCELCENACGGCSWSEHGKQTPVEGWEAIRIDVICAGRADRKLEESYTVLACPEYVPDRYAERYPFDRDFAEKRAAFKLRTIEKARGRYDT